MIKLRLRNALSFAALAGGFPAILIALYFVFSGNAAAGWQWALAAGIVVPWIAASWWLRTRIVYRLRGVASIVVALRQGDFSVRARSSSRTDPFSVLVEDINELAETLQAQRLDDLEAAILLRNVLGEIDVAVFTFDDQGRLCMVNSAGERAIGRIGSSAVGLTAEELGLGRCLDGPAERILDLPLSSGTGRWEMRRGQYRHLGRPRRLVMLSDVGRTLRAEELAAWKRLIRVMSHELNNSLAPIRSLADSLRRLMDQEPRAIGWEEDLEEGLSVISRRADALNRFVAAYAAVAKLPEPCLESVAVGPLVERICALESRMPVEVVQGPESVIRADRDQLEQMLINLVTNAVDATIDDGGSVVVTWMDDHKWLTILVRDEGVGLADTANLFVPFFSTRPGGTGVGLVLCRQIVEGHGGRISLHNRDDVRGCEVRVDLPLNH